MLNVEANRAYIFCQYCGAKNVIASEQMKTNINIGGIQITAKTEIENIIASAEYAVSIGQYSKANEMLVAAIMSGYDDYRIYITKAKIDLQLDHNRSLFESLRKLQQLEQRQNGNQAQRRQQQRPFASLCITAAKTALPHCTSQPSMSRWTWWSTAWSTEAM
jgi:hypothetical protein